MISADRQSRLARTSLLTAGGTVVSRMTGLARLFMVAFALGSGRVADAFNLANTTPNIVNDLVLGGVLAATFVPVFVNHLAHQDRRDAERSISAVLSVSLVVLVVATVVFEIAAPGIIDLYSIGAHAGADHHLAVTLLRYFAPQLACYGAISLIAAVLATQDRFAAVGFAPIVNNLVSIGVLALLWELDRMPEATLAARPGLVALVGLGTTAGVALQAIVLLPSLFRCGLRLHWFFSPHDPAIQRIVSLSGWTFGIVAANQVAVFVILALAYRVHTPLSGHAGGVSVYTYAYTFFQFPFGVAAASIVNVATPDLARAHAAGDLALLGRRFGTAVRRVLAVILPATVGYLVLATPALTLFLAHGAESAGGAHLTASVLVLFALGLPSYCVFFLTMRTFQAMQDTRTACICYAVENTVNIVVALATYHRLGVEGLALSYSVAYGVGVVVALIILRARLGTIGGRRLAESTTRAVALSVVMAVVVAAVSAATGTSTGVIGWAEGILAVVAGGVVYFGGAGVAGTLAARRAAERRPLRGGAHASRNRH